MSSITKLPESRERPLRAELSVREARDAYLAENGFTIEIYEARWTEAKVMGLRFRIPNTARHRQAIMLHDLHHAATGYGTDLCGEIEISAWEYRRGLRGLGLYMGGSVLGLVLMGWLVAPFRTLRAWRAGSGRGSLFQLDEDYDGLLDLSLGTLRERLGLPEDGLWRGHRGLNASAPGAEAERRAAEERAPGTAIAMLVQAALLLGGLATYLLVSETGSGRDDGYAFVVAIHLAILVVVCIGAIVHLVVRRRSPPR